MVFVFDHPQLNSLRSEADAMIGEGRKLCYAKLIWRYADFLWFIHRSWWKHPKDHHWRWDSASPWSIFLHFEGQNQSQIPLALPWLWFSDSFNASDISQFTIISQVFTSDIYVFGFLNSTESITEAPTNHAFFSHICGWCHLAFSWSREAFDNCACADTDWLIVAEYYLVLLIFQNSMSCHSHGMTRNVLACWLLSEVSDLATWISWSFRAHEKIVALKFQIGGSRIYNALDALDDAWPYIDTWILSQWQWSEYPIGSP